MKTGSRALVAMFLAAMFLMTGCTAKITEGNVADKVYRESYTTTSMNCMTYNADGICTMQVPQTNRHPESWRILISGNNEKGEIDTAWYRVSESTYERLEIGDFFRKE